MAAGGNGLSPRQFAGVLAVLTGAAAWFMVAMTVRDKPLVEAVGETVGATTAFLVLISVAGVTRR
ncbi:hypothetical protein [Virgisporangium aliadipatigenens]|nr:hypothetical protein [Virgisporangium aliadipatigenens]